MKRTWWKEAVIYQIYPRSFKDGNGDGIGDLKGITQQLGYLQALGVDVLWLSPVYASPNDDNGYDISDYCAIMTAFGTMDDFDTLLAEVHRHGMKLVMDLVVNHSSDEHEWFKQARSSKDNPYRDYYFWAPEPPNNWIAFFGGNAWEYDPDSGEYYLHLFTKKQPDLNWENPKVRAEVYNLMRFWLDKGIDGFRMDVIPFISKRLDWPDINLNDFGSAMRDIYANGPRLHEFLQEMVKETLSKYDVMSVGEAPGVPSDLANLYVGENRGELNMIFHFDHMTLDWGPKGKFDPDTWDLAAFKRIFSEWYEAIGEEGWISIFLDNHDFPRMVSRWGNDGAYRVESAKLLGTLLLTLRGTPSIYQGTEIGMTNVLYNDLADYRDVETLNAIQEHLDAGGTAGSMLPVLHSVSRDNVRTPVQWDDSSNAGFTTADEPWIKVNPNYTSINAQAALEDPDSIFHYYRQFLTLRKAHKTLVYGEYEQLDGDSDWLYAYRRWDEEGTFFIYLNFSEDQRESPLELPQNTQLLIGNYKGELTRELRPWEARVYQV